MSSFQPIYLCVKANSPSFSQNSPSLPQNSVRLSEFSPPKQYSRNSIPPVSWYSVKDFMTSSDCFVEGALQKKNGTSRTGGSTILKLVWGRNVLYFQGLGISNRTKPGNSEFALGAFSGCFRSTYIRGVPKSEFFGSQKRGGGKEGRSGGRVNRA